MISTFYHRRTIDPATQRPDKLLRKVPGNSVVTFLLPVAIASSCSAGPGPNTVNQTFMNMLFVAYDEDTDTYQVAISGTNGVCQFDRIIGKCIEKIANAKIP